MTQSGQYKVSLQNGAPRAIAAVHARLPMRDVPRSFGKYLDQVYAAGKSGAIKLDGQNIFIYRDAPGKTGEGDCAFGVGVKEAFVKTGNVEPTQLPTGRVATTTHIGDYAGLGAAHDAVHQWARANGHRLSRTRWEVYGHWKDGEPPRTDVFWLLES